MAQAVRAIGGLLLLAAVILGPGCVFDITDVKHQPAQLDPLADGDRSFVLATDTPITGAPCGFSRTLRKNTHWFAVGRLAEGEVYRSREQVLTVECSNVFEAYLVVADDRLVGFYLPVEKAFSRLDEAIPLKTSGQP